MDASSEFTVGHKRAHSAGGDGDAPAPKRGPSAEAPSVPDVVPWTVLRMFPRLCECRTACTHELPLVRVRVADDCLQLEHVADASASAGAGTGKAHGACSLELARIRTVYSVSAGEAFLLVHLHKLDGAAPPPLFGLPTATLTLHATADMCSITRTQEAEAQAIRATKREALRAKHERMRARGAAPDAATLEYELDGMLAPTLEYYRSVNATARMTKVAGALRAALAAVPGSNGVHAIDGETPVFYATVQQREIRMFTLPALRLMVGIPDTPRVARLLHVRLAAEGGLVAVFHDHEVMDDDDDDDDDDNSSDLEPKHDVTLVEQRTLVLIYPDALDAASGVARPVDAVVLEQIEPGDARSLQRLLSTWPDVLILVARAPLPIFRQLLPSSARALVGLTEAHMMSYLEQRASAKALPAEIPLDFTQPLAPPPPCAAALVSGATCRVLDGLCITTRADDDEDAASGDDESSYGGSAGLGEGEASDGSELSYETVGNPDDDDCEPDASDDSS